MQKTANALGLQQLGVILAATFLILFCFISGIALLIDESDYDSAGDVPGQLPDINSFGPKIDAIPTYQPQSTCDPTAKPGVKAFHDMILKIFPNTGDYGITRECSADGISEHKEGRAWDWKVNVNNPQDVATVNTLLKWLFATDKYGHKNAMITRLGIMYIIWDQKIWGAYRPSDGWRPYSGVSEHTDHVHFSFYWIGANKQTTFWNPQNACDPGAPCPMPQIGGGSSSVPPTVTEYISEVQKSVAAWRSGKVS